MRRRPLRRLVATSAVVSVCLVLAWSVAARARAPEAPKPDAGVSVKARPLKGLRAEVAALLLSGREGGELWAAVIAAPFPGEPGKSNLDFWVEIDGGRLLGNDAGEAAENDDEVEERESLRVEVHAYAITPSGALKGSLSEAFRLPLDELGDRLAEGGVKYSGRLEVEPGEYELRILIRETSTQRFLLRLLPIVVPAPEDGSVVLLPPFFNGLEDAWIQARGSAPPSSPWTPSALPVLRAGRPLSARLWIGGESRTPRIVVRALDRERKPLHEIEVGIDASGDVPPQGYGAFEMSFELPDELLTGNYFLETVSQTPAAASQTTQVYVLGLERQESRVVWTDLQRLASLSQRRREALDLAAKRRVKKRIALIVAAYREILDSLSVGSVEAALEELARLENEVLDSPDSEAATWLADAQQEVAVGLAKVDPESLIPLLYLHRVRHDRYLEASTARHVSHARVRVSALARIYAETSGSELAAGVASAALSDMASFLAGAKMRLAARRAMDEALALDEHNSTALLGIAVDHERRGEYEEAVVCLRRLLEAEPSSDEGRLRLAVNLRRAGDAGAASRQLRRIVDSGTAPWAMALAYQELARIFIDRDQVERAVRLLETALRRLPAQARLYVQLAYVLDRAGATRRAREVVRRTPVLTPDSPRLLYSRQAMDDNGDQREALTRRSLARLAVLAQALTRSAKSP